MPSSPPLRPAQRPRPRPTRSHASFRAISALILREMATRYGNSPGGYIWAILEPLGAICIMAIAFSLLVRNPPLGNNFIMFYATGYLPFQMYANLAGAAAGCIRFSRPLLQYPAVTWVDALLARLLLNALTGALVTLLLLSMLVNLTDTRTLVDLPKALESMCLMALAGMSIGTLNCVLFGLFPVWDRVFGIMTRPLLIASGVLFLYDDLPQVAQDILWYNPLLHPIGLMRSAFYPTYRPSYISVEYVLICSIIVLFLGVVLLSRYHRELLSNSN